MLCRIQARAHKITHDNSECKVLRCKYRRLQIPQGLLLNLLDTCSTLTPRFLDASAECLSMKLIRSSFGPPWYRCRVRNCVVRDLTDFDVWAVIKPLVGSWISAGASNGFGGSSFLRCAFARLHEDQKCGFLFFFRLCVRLALSESEQSESESEDKCKWTSFWSGKTTGNRSISSAIPCTLLFAHCRYDPSTNLPWFYFLCSSYLQ